MVKMAIAVHDKIRAQKIPAAAGIGPCRTAAGDYSMSSVSAASEAPPACTVIPQEVASGSIWSA